MAGGASKELRTSSYELFIGALSILSILNLALLISPVTDQVKQLVLIVDTALTIVFVIDFAIRVLSAPDKAGYFFKGGGWLDLLGSLPTLRIFRLFRVVKVGRLLHRHGARAIARDLLASRAQGGLLFVLLLAILTLEFGGIFVLGVEKNATNANILTGPEALWWGVVTITTVGYGDFYPVTNPGRAVGAITMLLGIAVLGTLTGYLANTFLAPQRVKPVASGPGDARAQLDEIRRQLDENSRLTADLHERLARSPPRSSEVGKRPASSRDTVHSVLRHRSRVPIGNRPDPPSRGAAANWSVRPLAVAETERIGKARGSWRRRQSWRRRRLERRLTCQQPPAEHVVAFSEHGREHGGADHEERKPGEPGHEVQSDPERAELLVVLGYRPRHPHRGCQGVGRHADARNDRRGQQRPPPHLTAQHESRGPPPGQDGANQSDSPERDRAWRPGNDPANRGQHDERNEHAGDPHRPSALVPHTATGGAPPCPQVDPLQGGGERDRISRHKEAAEQSGGGSRLVRGREGLLHGREGFAADAEPMGDGVHDGATGSRW